MAREYETLMALDPEKASHVVAIRRKDRTIRAETLRKLRDDPVAFVEFITGKTLQPWQRDLMRRIDEVQRTMGEKP